MCLFCKIVNGEIPSYKIYEDDNVLAFLDISQATIGHTLVILKKHYENVFEMDSEDAKILFEKVVEIAKKLKNTLNIQDLNILNNNGTLAGQTVFHHHVHLIPRYSKDDITLQFKTNKLSSEEFLSLQSKIKI